MSGTAAAAPRVALYLDLIRWDRPAGWLLLLWPTLSALWIAADGFPGWHLLVVFVAGTVIMRSAGCCVNDVADRDFDRHVKRTASRPVTSGRVSVREALALGAVLALTAFALVLTTNPPTIWLSVAGLAITLLYPFAKRVVSMPQPPFPQAMTGSRSRPGKALRSSGRQRTWPGRPAVGSEITL